MSSVQWNLDPIEVAIVDIFQISIIPEALDVYEATNDRRLLILSHYLGYKRVPAFFLQKQPDYSIRNVGHIQNEGNSVVLVFNLYHNFNAEKLLGNFNWCEIRSWKWQIEEKFDDQIYDDFQRALNVASYYEFERLKPLYFSSYLLFRRSDSISEPFLYQKVPVKRENSLCIRTSIQGSLKFVIDYRSPVEPGSYILVPPYEHPFCVISSTDQTISLRSVEKELMNIDIRKTLFVLITNPSVLMSKFYMEKSTPAQTKSLETFDYYNYTNEDIEAYLCQIFVDNNTLNQSNKLMSNSSPNDVNYETTIIEYPQLTIEQILSQMIEDRNERKIISECLGEGIFPSKRVPLTITIASFLSFFRFDFGFSDVKPPFHAQNLITSSTCRYERVGIPNILVNSHGSLFSTPADTAIDQWESQRFQPISGIKSCHFVVFCINSISPSLTQSFFAQFCHTYKLLNFGSLTPFPHDDAFQYMPYEDMPVRIENFFKRFNTSQFQQYPVLTFIVGAPIYDSNFMPHSILSYVRPEQIETASEAEMKTLAFVVYSRIRTFIPYPYGMIDISSNNTAAIFIFGFRYRPPFLLQRQQKAVTFHIAWDQHTEMSAMIDDIGSVLHVLPRTKIQGILKLINDAKQLLYGAEVQFTVSILAEGISEDLYDEICQTFGSELDKVTLFAVSPAPNVQVLFKEQFKDDAVIFAPVEQFMESCDGKEYKKALATCYVVAHTLPAYSVSLYTNDVWKPPETCVLEYAKQMSHLSWLSVKPGSESRTISYPPHICALLRKTGPLVQRICRYEFLPSLERI